MKREIQKYNQIYKESLDTFKGVYNKIKKINDKYLFDDDKISYFNVDVQTTYMLALDIVYQKVNFLLAESFKDMCHRDKIKFYDAYSYELYKKYRDEGFGCVVDTDEDHVCIIAPLSNDISDVFGLVHEVSHFYKKEIIDKNVTNNAKVAYELLVELIPVYSELLTYEYLIERYGNRTSFYGDLFERFDGIIPYTEQELDEKTCYRINKENFKYDLAFIIALYLYDKHKIDPDVVEVNIFEFSSKLGKADFNQLMSILKVPIRIENDKIYFLKNGLEELLESYKNNLISFADNFDKAVKREEKYINNGVIKVLSK